MSHLRSAASFLRSNRSEGYDGSFGSGRRSGVFGGSKAGRLSCRRDMMHMRGGMAKTATGTVRTPLGLKKGRAGKMELLDSIIRRY